MNNFTYSTPHTHRLDLVRLDLQLPTHHLTTDPGTEVATTPVGAAKYSGIM